MENKDNRTLYVVVLVVIVLLILYFIFWRNGNNSGVVDTNQNSATINDITAPKSDDGLSTEERARIIKETSAPKANVLGAAINIKSSEETSAPAN